MRKPALVAAGMLTAALLVASPSGHARAHSFSARVTNPWFPLKPGTRWVYTGVKDGRPDRDIVYVTNRVKVIDGAPCAVVSDRLSEQGKLRERTTDYYTQDAKGNVWYFGEATAELDRHGRVTSREGTWRAGRNGAKAGIFMPARLRVGASYRQEFLKGHAEDHFKVIGRFGRNGLLTKEWTPLEPGVIDHKMYIRGVGEVLEQTEKGGNERGELVSVRRR
jgi:hypothetical protein